jgi:hypothetical protein
MRLSWISGLVGACSRMWHVAYIGLTVTCIFQLHFSSESSLTALSTAQANALRIDLSIFNHWSCWYAFFVAHNELHLD